MVCPTVKMYIDYFYSSFLFFRRILVLGNIYGSRSIQKKLFSVIDEQTQSAKKYFDSPRQIYCSNFRLILLQ